MHHCASAAIDRLPGTRLLCVSMAICASLAATTNAQWIVVNLHPAGATSSVATGVHSGLHQAGTVIVDDVSHASLWSGSATSWVDLHPAGTVVSNGLSVDVNQEVGATSAGDAFDSHAALWTGTPESWVDLHPAGAAFSQARDVCGIRQVGYAAFGFPPNFVTHAAVWVGSANLFFDLHPPGMPASTQSQINATDCFQQVGYFRTGGAPETSFRASLWSNTAESWVDLSPANATASISHGVDNGQQVGEARIDGVQRASLWANTAASWVSLHPASAESSIARGVHIGLQAGEVVVNGIAHASLWHGTAASWLDLHAYLPAEFTNSRALSISHAGIDIYVVGAGFNSTTKRDEALMWVGISPCAGDVTNDGAINVNDLLDVIEQWGACAAAPDACAANVVNSGTSMNRVDVDDLLGVISRWGPCP